VVLVRMGERQRLDVAQAALERREVRQDQVDARLVRLGEQHAAVDDEEAARVLEDGHVAADLTEPAQRDDAQPVSGQGRRRPEAGVRMAHRSFTPPATRSARSCSVSAGVASTSGSRTGPPGIPSMPSAAFVVITPRARVIPVYTGSSSRWMARALATSPRR